MFKKALLAGLVAGLAATAAHAQAPAEVKIGVVTFLSGPAASPFGVPAWWTVWVMVCMACLLSSKRNLSERVERR